MKLPEEILEQEWLDRLYLSPAERFASTADLWEIYLSYGGSLDPDPDTQSPFFDPEEWREISSHGRSSVRVIRRC